MGAPSAERICAVASNGEPEEPAGAVECANAHACTIVAMIRHLTTNPCRDACGTLETGERLDGAPVYRCPGCDSTWVELPQTPEAPRQNLPEKG